MKKKETVFIPENLNVDELIQKFPPTGISKFNANHLLYIAGLIYSLKLRREKSDKETGFTKINSTALRSKVRNYKSYLWYLTRAGVLRTDGSYSSGKSTGYRFLHGFHGIKSVEIELEVRRDSGKKGKLDAELTKRHGFVTRWLSDGKLGFDYEGALKLYEAEKAALDEGGMRNHAQLGPFDDGLPAYENVEDYDYKYPENAWMWWRASIENMRKGEVWHGVDRKGFRLYSPLTMLKKTYRRFCSYEGKELISFDIKNSQPYVSLCLFKDSFYDEDSDCFNYRKVYSIVGKKSKITKSQYVLMRRKLSETQGCQDLQLYSDLVTGGKLYEYLMKEALLRLGKELTRDYVKKKLLMAFYSTNSYLMQENDDGAEFKRLFRELFPNVYEIFRIAKQKSKVHLACLAQAIESHIVLRVICRRIANERPDVPLFTIHDSIATTRENAEYVLSIMQEELERYVGHPPTIKEEPWQ